jgi:hypothetical protein
VKQDEARGAADRLDRPLGNEIEIGAEAGLQLSRRNAVSAQ